MVLWPVKDLGGRTLRFGLKGADVKQLHEFLRLQGYDLGEEETYGYLTKDAVRHFQREHGLVADGVAGRRFFALILGEDLPIRRRVHVVRQNETLEEIVQTYGVRPQIRKDLYPGQRLVFFDREIWGLCQGTPQVKDLAGKLTGLVCSTFTPDCEHPQIIKPAAHGEMNEVEIHQHLQTPKGRRAASGQFLQSAAGSSGLYLPWRHVAALDGVRYLKILRKLRHKLPPPLMLWAELGPGIASWRVWGGVDYAKVNELVDRVVLSLPLPSEPGPLFDGEKTEDLILTLLPEVHSWKILLRVPVCAVEWDTEAEDLKMRRIGYQQALSIAFRHGARLDKDQDGGLFYRYQSRGHRFQLRMPALGSIAKIAQLANRHNLAGVIIDELGQEDPRIWQALSCCFRPTVLNFSQE